MVHMNITWWGRIHPDTGKRFTRRQYVETRFFEPSYVWEPADRTGLVLADGTRWRFKVDIRKILSENSLKDMACDVHHKPTLMWWGCDACVRARFR